jgi:hypothetical protein
MKIGPITDRWGNQDGPYFGDLELMVHPKAKEHIGFYELHVHGKARIRYDQRWVLFVG